MKRSLIGPVNRPATPVRVPRGPAANPPSLRKEGKPIVDIAGAQSGVVVPGGSVFATMRGTFAIQTANVLLIVKTQTPRDSPNCHQKTSLD